MTCEPAMLSRFAILAALILSGCSESHSAASSAGAGEAAAPANSAAGLDSSASRTVTVDDPAVNMHAFTLKVPKNWKFTGMISRPGGCHGPAVAADGLTFTALAPDGITANEKLPGVSWAWISDGSSVGNCKSVNIGTAAGFLLNIAVPNLRPDAKDVTVVPLGAEMQQAIESRNREFQSQATPQDRRSIDSARVRLKYTYRGHPVEELLFTIVLCQELDMPAYPALHRAAVQRHLCNSTGTVIRRAPQGALDALLAQNPPPAQIDPQWDAFIQQRMRSQFNAWQKANNEQFQAIQNHFKDVTDAMLQRGHDFQVQQKNSFDNAMAQDRAKQASIDHAAQMQVRDSLNRQDFVDPNTGRRIETSNQYTHNWISADGQSVVLNGDPTFDPNGLIDPVRQSWTELIPVN
jgi:hypothetical protein